MTTIELTDQEVERRFRQQIVGRWYEPTPAGDGGDPSMFASPLVILGCLVGIGFWVGVGWLAVGILR